MLAFTVATSLFERSNVAIDVALGEATNERIDPASSTGAGVTSIVAGAPVQPAANTPMTVTASMSCRSTMSAHLGTGSCSVGQSVSPLGSWSVLTNTTLGTPGPK